MRRLINAFKLHGELGGRNFANPIIGEVSSYDPENYCCKITIFPDDPVAETKAVISGWIPVGTIWVGNGWGLFCPPSIGDMVEVDYQEGDFEAGHVDWRFFNDINRPVRAESGVFYIIHKTGASLKFENNGVASLKGAEIILDGYTKTTNHLEVATGASGVFTDVTGKMITVKNGIIVGLK